MSDQRKKDVKLNSFEKGMNKDVHPSFQLEGTYRDALNAVMENNDSMGMFSNEPSNELCFELPEGHKLKGSEYIKRLNKWVLFSYSPNTGESLISIASVVDCCIDKVLSSLDIDCDLLFDQEVRIPIEEKTIQIPVPNTVLYWQVGMEYWYLNIDETIECKGKNVDSCEDLLLFDCHGSPFASVAVIEDTGSGLLDVGSYQFSFQYEDQDGNTSNWFQLTEPVKLTGEDNNPGEKSKDSVEIRISNLSKEFDKVNIAVVKKTGGVLSSEFIESLPYGGQESISYNYYGPTSRELPLSIEEILLKKEGYIQGKGLTQIDDRLVLFDLKADTNLLYQTEANKIKTYYETYKVHATESDKFKGLMRDEVYAMAIKWNYCDGTSSAYFHIPGRSAIPALDFRGVPKDDIENCVDCDKLKWQVENTAFRTELYCHDTPYVDPSLPESELTNFGRRMTRGSGMEEGGLISLAGDQFGVADRSSSGPVAPTIDKSTEVVKNSVNSAEKYKESEETFYTSNRQGSMVAPMPIEDLQPISYEVPVAVEVLCEDACEFSYQYVLVDPNELNDDNIQALAFAAPEVNEGGCGSGNGSCGQQCGGCAGGRCGACGVFDGDMENLSYEYYTHDIGYQTNGTPTNRSHGGCEPKPIYSEDGCLIIGYEPTIYSSGKMGYWQSDLLYPMDKDCHGNFLYGDLAGKPIRHHKIPGTTLEPHFISHQNGVPNYKDINNDTKQDTYVFLMGVRFENIELPKETPKPLDVNNPFTIGYVKRDENNKSVIGKGIFTSMFKGTSYDREYVFPKNGVNSLEYYDRHIEGEGSGTLEQKNRGGTLNDVASFNFHSPETSYNKPPLNATDAVIELEIYGTGFRHGLYEEGEDPMSISDFRKNQGGARQHINLNHYQSPSDAGHDYDPCCIPFEYNLKILANGASLASQIDPDKPWNASATADTALGIFVSPVTGGFDSVSATISFKSLDQNYSFDLPQSNSPTQGFLIDHVVNFERIFNGTIDLDGPVGGYTKGFSNAISDVKLTISGTTNIGGVSCSFTEEVDFFRIKLWDLGIWDDLSQNDGRNEYTANGLDNYSLDGDEREFYIPTSIGPGSSLADFYVKEETNYHFKESCGGFDEYKVGCVKGQSYAKADSIVRASQGEAGLTYPMMNIGRESSVYLEFEQEPDYFDLNRSIDVYVDSYGGKTDSIGKDRSSDGSFMGDVVDHQASIHSASTNYGSLKRYLPKQYGSLESAVYTPIGLKSSSENTLTKSISGVAGDTYILQHNFIRKSFVSDRRGRTFSDVSYDDGRGDFASDVQELRGQGFGRVAGKVLEFLDDKFDLGQGNKCNTVPRSGDIDDPRNTNGLRFGRAWDGDSFLSSPDTYPAYAPGTQKTLISFWVETQFDLENLSRGIKDEGEFNADDIPAGWGLDSSMSQEEWDRNLLNQYHRQMNEISTWKQILRFILLFFIKVVVPVKIFIQGISMTIIGAIVAAVLIIVYLLFMRIMNKLITLHVNRMLGIDNCIYDRRDYNRDKLIKGFVDNFYKENPDFREKNIMENSYGMDSGYSQRDNGEETTTTIVYSNKQMAGSKKDSYKNFQVNSFLDAPSNAGKIQDIFTIGGKAFIHTEDSLFGLPYQQQQLDTNASSIYLGTGTLFGQPAEILSHVEEGQFGTKDPWASVDTIYGRFFVDREARKIFLFDGSTPVDITMFGMKKFFRKHLTLKMQEAFPDYCENTVGYIIGVDNKYDRILFTKIDYAPINPGVTRHIEGRLYVSGKPVSLGDPNHFTNEGFTLSYYPQRKMWVSFHSYIPTNYLHDRYHLLSEKHGKFWRHNEEDTDYHSFYGIDRNHRVEFVVNSKALENFSLQKMVLDFEAMGADGRFLNSTFERVEIKSPFMEEDRTIDLREASVEDLSDIYSDDETESRVLFENGKLIIPDISSENFPVEGKYVRIVFTLTSNDQELYTRLVASFTENWVTD